MIAGVFLAAGQSKRFGSDKLLHELDGLPLLYHSLRAPIESRLPRVYVVLRAGIPALEQTLNSVPDLEGKITLVTHGQADLGMMSSLKKGLQSLGSRYEGAMIILADMPYITAELIDRLISEFERTNGIVIPECNGELYHPRVIPKRLFPEFLRLGDDEKGSKIIDRFGADVVTVTVGTKTNYVDIDDVGDLG
jgi:molybdenum cofactor cytidylyltransferase